MLYNNYMCDRRNTAMAGRVNVKIDLLINLASLSSPDIDLLTFDFDVYLGGL